MWSVFMIVKNCRYLQNGIWCSVCGTNCIDVDSCSCKLYGARGGLPVSEKLSRFFHKSGRRSTC